MHSNCNKNRTWNVDFRKYFTTCSCGNKIQILCVNNFLDLETTVRDLYLKFEIHVLIKLSFYIDINFPSLKAFLSTNTGICLSLLKKTFYQKENFTDILE